MAGAEASRRRRIGLGIAVYSFTFLFCLTFAELAVRAVRPQSDLRRRDLFFRYEPFLGFEGIPGKTGVFASAEFKTRVTHNSAGFRDAEHTRANTTGRLRLLALGDSFTWGHGVENDEIWVKVLESLDDRLEVLNLGGPGGDPPSELKVYVSRGVAYEHDVVVLGFYLGNDVVAHRPTPETAPPQWGFDGGGRFALIGTQLPPDEVEAIRARSEQRYARRAERPLSSRIHYWFTQRLQLLTLFENSRDYYSNVLKGSYLYTRALRLVGLENERAYPFLDYCRAEDPPDVAYGWRLTEATLRRLRAEAAAAGARVYVVFIPDTVQVSRTLYERTLRRYGYDPDAYDVDRPNRRLAALCAALGIDCLDLTPALRRAASGGERLYYLRDPHWTPAGHRVAAETVYRDLRGRDWF